MNANTKSVRIAETLLNLEICGDELRSLGRIQVRGTDLRNPATRFLPWFDQYDGHVFRRFRMESVDREEDGARIRTTALSDPDTLFQERRDASGDLCLRAQSWDAPPVEARFDICLRPAGGEIDGRRFTGFTYWFEYRSESLPIHRIADRQTWELGGGLRDVNVVCRNLFDAPRKRVTRAGAFSTAGLEHPAGLMPGSLWARWSLLPSFDMQYGAAGLMVAWFERVALIRSVIESVPGEDWIRYVDLHFFEQSKSARTPAKTVLFCPDRLDDTEALNFWTRLHDQEQEKARRQFDLPPEDPPAVAMSIGETRWHDFHFDTSYEEIMDTALEFGADFMGTDAVWENGEALRKRIMGAIPAEKQAGTALAKLLHQNMCCTLDFEVASEFGGEAALKRLCERAAEKGLGVIIWLGLHVSPLSFVVERGPRGVVATKESGCHPDTGYPGNCWTLNMNAPIGERVREQILGVCRRCGVAGIRWDSFSNLGWWQVDYSKGDMRPQFDRTAELFGALRRAGIRVWAEGVTNLSNQSCCGLHGGDVYAGDLLGYSYNSAIPLGAVPGGYPGDKASGVLTGAEPFDTLFRCFAHKRIPPFAFYAVPRDQRNDAAAQAIKTLIRLYRAHRGTMVRRTVLKQDAGVLWEDGRGARLFFSFADQTPPVGGAFTDADTGQPAPSFCANRIYIAARR